MSLSLVPMLVAGESISFEVCQALRRKRWEDVAELLMREYWLNCAEAGDLLNLQVC